MRAHTWRWRGLAVAIWVATACVCGVTVALFRGHVLTPSPSDPPGYVGEVLFICSPLAFGFVGALVATRRRENPIGWILCVGMLCTACYSFAAGYAWTGLVVLPEGLSGAQLAGWFSNWLWMAAPLSIALTLQLFPDGHVVSRRWRLSIWITLIGFAVGAVAAASVPGPLNNIPRVDNPFGWDALGGLGAGAFALAGLFELVAFGLGFASLAVRFRCSRGIERLQLKWLAYSGSLLPLVAVINMATPVFGSWGVLPVWIAIYAIPIAIATAIFRHRLYDINLIIRRTVVYAVLSTSLVVVYWAGAVVLQQALRPFTAGSDFAIVASTLAVAALFQPLRRRIQLVVDRRFYRQAYDATRALESFSAHLRDEIDLDTLQIELLEVVQRTVEPARASVWLRWVG